MTSLGQKLYAYLKKNWYEIYIYFFSSLIMWSFPKMGKLRLNSHSISTFSYLVYFHTALLRVEQIDWRKIIFPFFFLICCYLQLLWWCTGSFWSRKSKLFSWCCFLGLQEGWLLYHNLFSLKAIPFIFRQENGFTLKCLMVNAICL